LLVTAVNIHYMQCRFLNGQAAMASNSTKPRRREPRFELKPLLVTPVRARQALDISETKYRQLVRNGILKEVQLGLRKMTTYDSVVAAARGT
jgi:hypothetical protein